MLTYTEQQGSTWRLRFGLEDDDRTEGRGQGTNTVRLNARHVSVQLPVQPRHAPHPDAEALAIFVIVRPWIGSRIQVPRGVSIEFANLVKKLFALEIGPVDKNLAPRTPGTQPVVSYSAGYNSAAASVLFPDAVHLHHRRVTHPDVPDNGRYRADAIEQLVVAAGGRGRDVHIVRSDFEHLCSPYPTLPHWFGFAVGPLLLADHFDAGALILGGILEITYLQSGTKWVGEPRRGTGIDPLPELVGLPIMRPLAGLSEVATMRLSLGSELRGIVRSCLGGTFDDACHQCAKCLRKDLLQAVIDEDERAMAAISDDSAGWVAFAQPGPVYMQAQFEYALARIPDRLKSGPMRQAIQRMGGVAVEDTTWLDRAYPPAVDYGVPAAWQQETRRRIEASVGWMSQGEIAAMKSWDRTPPVSSVRHPDEGLAANPAIADLTQAQLRHYLDLQFDPVAGVQAKRFSLATTTGGWSLTSAVGLTMGIAADGSIAWALDESRSQGEALWKHSLGYLPLLLEKTQDPGLLDRVLASFWEYMSSPEWAGDLEWATSKDHALAMRIRAICSLACRYRIQGWRFPDAAVNILHQDLGTVVAEPDSYITTNNHGAMVSIALIHAAQIFTSLDDSIAELGWESLRDILGDIFDEQGVAGENSPEYQSVWISLLKPLARMSRDWPISTAPAGFSLTEVVSRAEAALGHFTDHTGRFLPIGDARRHKSPVPPARNALLVTEEQGFACYTEGDTLLTFNCGHRNYAHKHCDDTSITLSYGGRPLIIDSGYFGHDWRDERVVYTKSQAAHSGLFLEEFDDLHPGKLLFPGREILRGRLEREGTTNAFLGTVAVNDGRFLKRRLEIIGPHRFLIEDLIIAPPDSYSVGVRRFMLPKDSQISVHGHQLSISIGDVLLRLVLESGTLSGPVRTLSGVSSPAMRGWNSPGAEKLEPCQCVELPIDANTKSTITVDIEANRHLGAVSAHG